MVISFPIFLLKSAGGHPTSTYNILPKIPQKSIMYLNEKEPVAVKHTGPFMISAKIIV